MKSGATIFYTIASDPQRLFVVVNVTGELTLKNDIDERQAALGTKVRRRPRFLTIRTMTSSILPCTTLLVKRVTPLSRRIEEGISALRSDRNRDLD